jgi:hypothetical protein
MVSGADSVQAIWDWWDDPSLGEVVFRPWLASQDTNAPREPDSASMASLRLVPSSAETVWVEVAVGGPGLNALTLDYCTVELWSTHDSTGITVALPERDLLTGAISLDGGFFRGWFLTDTLSSSDPGDRLLVLPGGVVHARTAVNEAIADSLLWLAAHPPPRLFPSAAAIGFYPNPCSDGGTVVLRGAYQGVHEVRLYDLLGRLVEQTQIVVGAGGEGRCRWTAANRLGSGVYLWQARPGAKAHRILLCR